MKKAGRLPSPRVEITKPVRAVAYRAKVQPFDSVKFLDMRALSRARRATVEIGTVETRKGSVTVVAHIRNGSIVGLAPKDCAGCLPRRGKKLDRSKFKAVMRALDRAGLGKLGGPVLPIKVTPTASLSRMVSGFIITDIDIHFFDICITWRLADGTICTICIFGRSFCVDAISGP
jgi:hypothetical protein